MKSRVREWRELRGYTQAQLAGLIGVTATTIQNLENDPEPLLKTLRLAAILGCRPEELVKESEFEAQEQIPQSSRKPTPSQLAAIKDLLAKPSKSQKQ